MIGHFGSSYCYNYKFIIFPSNVFEKLRIKYLGSFVQRLFTKEKHILKRTYIVNFSMLTINPERGLKLTFQKDAFMFWSRVCRFYFETDKVLGADFVRCDMNNVTIPYALCIEKKTLCTSSSVSERGDMDSENHSVVIRSIESHSEIDSIKTDNIDEYIINNNIVRSPWVTTTSHTVSEYSQPELK